MSVQSSASLKRLNHLQCEMGVVYHEMSHGKQRPSHTVNG